MTGILFPIHYDESDSPEFRRRQISKTSNKLGLIVFLYYTLLIIFSNIFNLLIIDTNPPFLQNTNTSIKYEFISIFYASSATLISTIIYFVFSRNKFSDIIQIRKIKLIHFFPVVFAGMAVSMIANFASDILAVNFSLFNLKNTVSFSNQTDNYNDIIIYIISTAIIPTITEELIFRGILLGTLRKYGNNFAIITSSIIFAAIHGNISQIPFTFILGLVLAFSVCKTDSIFPAIIIHFMNNLYAVILDIIRTKNVFPDNIFSSLYYIVIALFCTLGILSFIYLIKKDKKYFNATDYNSDNILSFKDKILSFTITPGILLLLSLFITLTISNIGII